MAKLFEVNEVTYNAEKIERVVRMGACCNVQIGGVVVSCGAGYEQFVQLWGQALQDVPKVAAVQHDPNNQSCCCGVCMTKRIYGAKT